MSNVTAPEIPGSCEFKISPAMAVLICFAAGIACDRLFDVHWQWSLAGTVTMLAAWLAIIQLPTKWPLATNTNRKMCAAIVCLSAAIFFAGSYWHHGRWNWFASNDLSSYCQDLPVPVCIRAKILGEAKLSVADEDGPFNAIPTSTRTQFRIQPTAIRNGTDWASVDGQARLVVYGIASEIKFGDQVEVFGHLAAMPEPTGPGNFDLRNYHRARNLACAVYAFYEDAVIVREQVGHFSNASLLSSLRTRLNEMIWSHVGPAQAGFASAILLGNREQIARSDQQSFLKTGTAHLLAISGLHVGILASLFLIAYKIGLIRRNWALISTILFVAFYAWLVEFRPPVVRASILLSLFCCGGLIGRTGCEFNILALAGFIVLIINPSDLFHLGPQLSFLAVTTLVVFKEWIFPVANSDPIKRLIRNSRPAHVRMLHGAGRTVKQMLLVSFLIWLFGLPVVAMHFHLVTPVACIVNPLVMIPISLALFSGLGVCLLSWWLPGSGWVLGGINSISLAFVSDTIAWAESLEWGHWWTAGPWAGSLVLFYVVLLGLLVAAPKRKHEFAFCWVLVWILTGWMFLFQAEKFWKRNFQTEGQVTFADVGHGSCVLLEMPHGRTMLYDAGSLSSPAFATQVISNLLWSNQLEHIDALVISHADLDHFNAIPDLIERFSVGTLYVSVPMLDKESESLERLFELVDEKQIPVRTLAWSDRVELEGGAKLEIVLPPEFGTDDSDNSDSIVISVDVNDQKLLLPGDLEGNGMHLLLQSKPVDYDVVMMPHHGSKNSRPIEFIHWCNPDSAVISCSKNKLNQRVAKDVRQMDCQLFSTAESGSIRMRMNQSGIQVEHYANAQWNEMSELR